MISKFSTSVRNFSRRIISSPASATPQNGDSPTGDDNMVSSNTSTESPISEESVDPRQSTISNDNGDSNYSAVILDETFSIPNSCAASDESSDDEIGGSREENDQHQYNRPKIYKIARELYQTENAYVKGLKLIDEDFRKVIRKINLDKEFVSESDLFSSINQICGLNEGLLKDLKERLLNWDECPRISDIMKTFAPFFKTYTTYVSDYEKTNTLLQETMKIHPEFATAVQVFQTSRCKNLTISSYMLKPIQRIPRYRLLMEDYLKNLPADSEELPDAQSALASIIDAANKINENMKIGDNLKKILRVQERLRIRKDYNLVVPHRIYIKEGLLGKVCRKVVQIRMFFLFSDILLYTEPEAVTHSFRYKDEFDLKNMQITVPTDQNLYGESFAFQINHKKRQFILKAKSIEERDEWVKELQTAAEEERNRLATFGENVAMPKTFIIGKQAPLMIADDHVTRCQICDKMFTTFFRRHHCRGCGKVVCGECSNNRAPLEYKDYKADRVCDACYEILLSGLTERINNRPTDHYPILEYQYERRDEVVTRFRKHSSKTGTKIRRRKDRCSFLKEETGNAYSLKDPVDVSNKGDFKNWKRKFCIVRGNENVLYIYDAVEDKKAAKEVVLVGWTISKKTIAKEDDSTSTDNIIELSHFNQSSADAPVSPNHNANQLMFIRPPADKFNEWFDCILKATQLTDPRDSVFGESTDI